MRFTAHAYMKATSSGTTTEFEVPDEELAGLSEDDRSELLSKQAEEAIFENGEIEIWFTEGGEG